MAEKFATPEDYISTLSEERKVVLEKLRTIIKENLKGDFEECINYKMLGYVVPHSTYPDGYHCSPKLPLPFINLASQKNFIALYHMGIYADKQLYNWFVSEYPKHAKYKLDMGKSCIRFKKLDDIPYELIVVLIGKMSINQWIDLYEKNIKT